MGPVIIAIQIGVIITTAAVIGQTIAVEVIQKQIEAKIKAHQEQFNALKEIKVYMESLLKQSDLNIQQDLQKEAIFQNISEIQAFLKLSKNNLSSLVQNYPNQLVGYIVPSEDQTKKILATFKPGNNLQNTRYFINKYLNKQQLPSFAAGALQIVSSLAGVNWKQLGMLLLTPGMLAIQLGASVLVLRNFLLAGRIITSGVAFASILSAIGLALNIYSIIDNAAAIKKLLKQKDQINKQLALLPKTETQAMDVIKGSLSSFLAYLIVAGDLIARIRERLQFVSLFTFDQQLKKQIKNVLEKLQTPHSLITLQTIRKTSHYATQLQDLYKGGVTQGNVKSKIIKTNQIFAKFFKDVRVNELNDRIRNALNLSKDAIIKANKQFSKMKSIAQILQQVIKSFQFKLPDEIIGHSLQQFYLSTFSKKVLDNNDKLILVKCVASVRSFFSYDDKLGLTYYGYKLSAYRNNSSKYANIAQLKSYQEDITYYQKEWVAQYQSQMLRSLSRAFSTQKRFQYYRSSLNFQPIGNLSEIKLQVTKSMYFKGLYNLYKVECGLVDNPEYKISIYTGENINNIKIRTQAVLQKGMKLLTNQFLYSNNGQYQASLEYTGDLVIKRGNFFFGKKIWSTHIQNKKFAFPSLFMQQDGNLCIYDHTGKRTWQTHTQSNSNPNYRLILQNNGHLVIYDQVYKKIWSS